MGGNDTKNTLRKIQKMKVRTITLNQNEKKKKKKRESEKMAREQPRLDPRRGFGVSGVTHRYGRCNST
jgi:hypothetical protein